MKSETAKDFNRTQNQSASSSECCKESNADWLAQRKQELREVMEQKSKELSQRAQHHVSKRLCNYESALNQASEQLARDSETQPSRFSRELAAKIRETADYVGNTPPEKIVSDTGDTVKAAPMLTLGAAILAGLALGRIISNATQDDEEEVGEPELSPLATTPPPSPVVAQPQV